MARIQTGGSKGGGQFYKDPAKEGSNFQATQRKKASARSRFFRNFHRTKQKAYMTTYNDTQFVSVNLLSLSLITGGDPQTAFDGLIDVAWMAGAKTGNIKDLVAGQESAYKAWMERWTIIAWELAAQLMLRPLVSAMTESSTTATTNATIAIWKQSDWDQYIASISKLDCPEFVYRFLKPFLFYVRMTESYDKAGITIPPSYFIPICYRYALATLETAREAVKANSSEAMLHCMKFGIPFSKFSIDKLKAEEVSRSDVYNNQDRIAFFSIAPYYYTWKTGPTPTLMEQGAILTGANLTTDFTNIHYIFDDGQDMSILHAFYQFFGATYNVTNCKYGEIILPIATAATEYHTSILHMANLGTAWTVGLMSGHVVRHVMKLFASYWNGDANKGMQWNGAEVTAAQTTDVVHWEAFDENKNLCYDTGNVKGTEAHDSCENAAKFLIYGD